MSNSTGASGQEVVPTRSAPVTPPTLGYSQRSDVWERLSKAGNQDLVFLVAYGLYKQRKREWIRDHLNDHGRAPTAEECSVRAYGIREQELGALYGQARNELFRFADEYAKSQIAEISKVAFNERATSELEKVNNSINSLKGFRHHVVGHVAGYVVLILLFFFFNYAIEAEFHLKDLGGLFGSPDGASDAQSGTH